MKLFGKRDSSPSRRNIRFWMMRIRKFAVMTVLAAIVGSGIFYVWSHHMIGQMGDWATEKTIQLSARAGFRVNEILVTGRNRISQEELLSRLNIKKGAPIFGVSIGETQDKLADIPWISRIAVSRRLPDRIIVDISERTPAALWQYKQKVTAIDAEGKVLTDANLDQWQDLPLLVGEDAPAHAAELIALLNAEPDISSQLESAVRVGNRRWDLRMENGLTIKLPEEGAELALAKVALYQKKDHIFAKNLATIDLRIPDKFVIAPKADAAPAADTPADGDKNTKDSKTST